jgi:hypothetical protein
VISITRVVGTGWPQPRHNTPCGGERYVVELIADDIQMFIEYERRELSSLGQRKLERPRLEYPG